MTKIITIYTLEKQTQRSQLNERLRSSQGSLVLRRSQEHVIIFKQNGIKIFAFP